MASLTPYERSVLRDARDAFENPFRTPLTTFAHAVERKMKPALDEAPDEATAMMIAASSGAMAALGELAARTLRPQRAWADLRREGFAVRSREDVAALELWEADEGAEPLRARYLVAGAGMGMLAAAMGPTALATGVPLLAATALRAIQDYAIHYGFDIDDPAERAYALHVLVASVVPGVTAEEATPDHLARVAEALARVAKAQRRRPFGLPLALHVLARLLKRRSGATFVRRAVGLAVAAANAWLLLGVADTAQAAYRRRFLARRYERAQVAAERPALRVASSDR